MTKKETLEMLRELVRDASYAKTEESDWSGCNTKYYVDQEKLLSNIEEAIDDARIQELRDNV